MNAIASSGLAEGGVVVDGEEGLVLDGYASAGIKGDYPVEVRVRSDGFDVKSADSQRWISPNEYAVTPRALRWRRRPDEYLVVRKADAEALVLGVSSLTAYKKLLRFQRLVALVFVVLLLGAPFFSILVLGVKNFLLILPLPGLLIFSYTYFQKYLIRRSFSEEARPSGVVFERFLAASDFEGKELLVDGRYPTDHVGDRRGGGSVSDFQAADPVVSAIPQRRFKLVRIVFAIMLSLVPTITVMLFFLIFFPDVPAWTGLVILAGIPGPMVYLWLFTNSVAQLSVKSGEEIDDRLAASVFDFEVMRNHPRWLAAVAPAIFVLSLVVAVGMMFVS